MNIFALDNDPTAAACSLCDQHIGKMLLGSPFYLPSVLSSVYYPTSARTIITVTVSGRVHPKLTGYGYGSMLRL